jgi:8-oxo-dGTP pyrophosphatase MutT (NUDIX family)
MMGIAVPEGITRIRDCRLALTDARWSYADRHADDIAAHWQRRSAESAAFFNGRILLTVAATLIEERLEARATIIEFAAFLHWRETGYSDVSVCDAFGSALILSADGALMLGRQRTGNLNAGLLYPPGGFIDPRDVRPDGEIDVAASIAREIAEEAGLDSAALIRDPGFILSRLGQQLAIGAVHRSPLPTHDLRDAMIAGLAHDPERELVEIVPVTSRAEATDLPVPVWTRGFIDALLP